MPTTRNYENYEDYINFQKKKTTDPEKRKKWLNEEWQSKIDGFKAEFSKFGSILNSDTKALCLGARTGQEVVALKELGVEDSIGIDIVPQEPNVILGDIHNLEFEDDSFDFVYTNILDHSIDPRKMLNEAERVLKPTGLLFVQIQLGINQDEYTEFEVKDPVYDILPLLDETYCIHSSFINPDRTSNFAGMNYELLFQKDKTLQELNKKYGNIRTISVPEDFKQLWKDINHETQLNKLDKNNILEQNERDAILDGLSKRAYYLTRIAEVYNCKNIAEVGTAEGWQFYSFCKYAAECDGTVFSCDPRDVRNKKYSKLFEEEKKVGTFVNATSKEMSQLCSDVDLFYIDGMHERGSVLTDINNLQAVQTDKNIPIWIFDDFDVRFGCFQDIAQALSAGKRFKVWYVGKTASGYPSHQAIVTTHFKVS
jgi:ubiquinone/menaquinone biosynthesis C-methylase UbiE